MVESHGKLKCASTIQRLAPQHLARNPYPTPQRSPQVVCTSYSVSHLSPEIVILFFGGLDYITLLTYRYL